MASYKAGRKSASPPRASRRGTRATRSSRAKPKKKKVGTKPSRTSLSGAKTPTKKRIRAPKKKSVKKPIKRPIKKRTREAKKQPIKKITRKPKAKPKRRTTKKEIQRLEERLAKLREKQEIARGKSKRSRTKRELKKEQERIEETRAKEAIASEGFPTSPRLQAQSREENWERMAGKFSKFLSQARKTKQLPKPGRARKKFNNPRTKGEERYEIVEEIVSPESVQDILYHIDQTGRKLSGKQGMWYANLVFSGFGEKLIGSKPKILNLADPDARFFQTEGYDNTGVWKTYEGMMQQIEKMLDEYSNSPRTIVYLHHVKLMNYDRKSS